MRGQFVLGVNLTFVFGITLIMATLIGLMCAMSTIRPIEEKTMTPLGDDDFIWTFPTYLLARNFATDPATGNIMFNTDLKFIAPAVAPTGEQGVAMFTDRYLAEEYLAQTNPELGMRLLEIPSEGAGDFLRHCAEEVSLRGRRSESKDKNNPSVPDSKGAPRAR